MHSERLSDARVADLKSVAYLLQQSTEALLAADDLSAARRILVELARHGNLESATISLLDGHVFAATEPAAITVAVLPVFCPSGLPVQTTETRASGHLHIELPLDVPGRGGARLSAKTFYPR